MARKTRDRKLRMRYAVLGEGRTEQYYLKHLKATKDYGYSIKPSLFKRLTIEGTEEIIDELLSGGTNKIIYLFDYDTVVNQAKQQKFNKLKKKYAQIPEVFLCETMLLLSFGLCCIINIPQKNFEMLMKQNKFCESIFLIMLKEKMVF